jgi:beta-aspartyl-peptidase (threonine type)
MHEHGDAIELARRVMAELPHVLITGPGADRLASETGLEPMELLTPEAREIWRDRLDADSSIVAGDESTLTQVRALARALALDPQLPPDVHGTVNLIVRDRNGNIACGVSTSGFAWKYPGRLGDSPIIGAGNYADDRWGAAACTGFGELAMRCCTAHSVVTFMRFGEPLEGALRMAMTDIAALRGGGQMNIVAIDRDGNHAAASSVTGKTYIYMTEDMDTYESRERLHVPMAG